MGIEIGAFLINTAIGIGANLVGSWLSPKKQPEKTIAEDIPQLGQGNPLYGIWGLSFCPGNLLYATPPSLAGHGDDRSTYGMLGFSNPDSTAGLVALRINNLIAASSSPIFPILNATGSPPRTTITRGGVYNAYSSSTDGANLNPDGLLVKNDLGIIYQMDSPVANPNFGVNGYSGLQYEGLTWVGINSSPRNVYGGANTRFVIYAKNRVTSGELSPYTVKSDTPVAVTIRLGFNSGKELFFAHFPMNFARGFFGSTKVFVFDSRYNSAIVALSGESTFVVTSYSKYPVAQILYSYTGGISPGKPVPPVGSFPVILYSTYVPTPTNSLILGEKGGQLFEVILGSNFLPPFTSTDGVVRDSTNSIIYTTTNNFKCYGWDGAIYSDSLAVSDSITELLNPTVSPSGVTEVALTDLSTIIEDLLRDKRPDVVFNDLSTPVDVVGFTSDYDNVDSTIVDLCTAYGKLIFEDGEGEYWFTDYPDPTPVQDFLTTDLLERNLEFTPEYNQPSQIEFSYRSAGDQLTEKIIHIGYSNRSNSTANVKYNLSLEEEEAKRLAWNVLFLRSHTNAKLTIRSFRSIPRAGLVISCEGELYLVGSMEVGQDMSFRYTCVNYVPLNDSYTSYMLEGSSVTLDYVSTPPTRSFVLSAETRAISPSDPTRMGIFYSNTGQVANVRRNDGDLTTIRAFAPDSGGFTGQVLYTEERTGDVYHGYSTIAITRTLGNAFNLPVDRIIRIGQSWVRYGTVTSDGDTYILTGIETGMFGSYPAVSGGDYVLAASTTNELTGYKNPAILPLVLQGSQENIMKSVPESLVVGSAPPFGVSTVRFPHGYPVSGVATAQVVASAYGGVLRVWFSKPGNQDNGFFLNDKIGGVNLGTTRWFVQSGLAYLFEMVVPYFTDEVEVALPTLPVGTFSIYQAGIGHTIGSPSLFETGSFTFNGSSY